MTQYRLWKFIAFSSEWESCDTSLLDEIAPSWLARREVLQGNSTEYEAFIEKLKRKHAIETGVVERMYDIEKGVTETLINEGFISSLVSHGDTNIPKERLFDHLQDHLDAVEFIFDVVKENRPLTKGFILELHQLTTRHQEHAEGRDQFGNKTAIPLLRGKFKERENNPTREDGTVILYCPPEHVEAEMDRLIEIYEQLCEQNVHPLIIATWVHHAFTTIHPFQDGNGRVVRLIASLILIKYNFFPITVLREEAKIKYIQALEEADNGLPQKLVSYFAEIQRRNIEEALNLREVSQVSLDEVTNALKGKLSQKLQQSEQRSQAVLAANRLNVFEMCYRFLNEYRDRLEQEFAGSLTVYIGSGRPDDETRQHYYYKQIVSYAKMHAYFFNRNLPRAYFVFGIALEDKKYELVTTLHHYGYDDSVLAIGAFLEYKGNAADENSDTTLPLDLKPHIISIKEEVASKEKNIRLYLEQVLTAAVAQIANEV
jgi:Fic family protein